MSGASDDQDKSHDPTPSRLEKARREGDVAQSKEANAAAQQLAFYGALLFAGATGSAEIARRLSSFLQRPEDVASFAFARGGDSVVFALLAQSALPAAPFFLAPTLVVVLALVAQRAVTIAPAKLKPKFSRISPMGNARQKFGPHGLGEFLKSALKLAAVIGLAYFVIGDRIHELPAFSRLSPRALGALLLQEATLFIGLMVAFLVGFATIDLPLAHANHARRLRMSNDELRRESKENEGDPYFKMLRREKAKALSVSRMMRDVPKASVVIVNPEHYAVALKWSRESRRAPVCVAKGVDHLAAKIKEIAAASGVPIRSDPVTARAIYATVKVGREIERAHYAAVAAALYFAQAVSSRRAQS